MESSYGPSRGLRLLARLDLGQLDPGGLVGLRLVERLPLQERTDWSGGAAESSRRTGRRAGS
jgi:hypothetical protein